MKYWRPIEQAADLLEEFQKLSRSLIHSKVSKVSGCWNWTGKMGRNGYGRIGAEFAHRMSWLAFHGPVPEGMEVLHKCDNKKCVNPDHLFVGTHRDNMQDMLSKGRANYSHPGTINPNAKITEEQAIEIFNRPKKRGICVELSKEFGISEQIIGRIRNGKRWKHIHDAAIAQKEKK